MKISVPSLRLTRVQLRLSQKELAQRASLPPTRVSLIEGGLLASVDDAQALSAALGVSLSAITRRPRDPRRVHQDAGTPAIETAALVGA